MKFKHTKGPWKATKPQASNGFWHIDYAANGYPNGSVATAYGELAEYDARLIAAAPDMLTTIINLLRVIPDDVELLVAGEILHLVDIVETVTGYDIKKIRKRK